MQDPLARRQAILEESLKWHQLAFDADVELQWIAEKRQIVESKHVGKSLTEATNMLKKQDQLDAEVATHGPRVEATVSKGEQLVRAHHMSSKFIKAKCSEVTQWNSFSHLLMSLS